MKKQGRVPLIQTLPDAWIDRLFEKERRHYDECLADALRFYGTTKAALMDSRVVKAEKALGRLQKERERREREAAAC